MCPKPPKPSTLNLCPKVRQSSGSNRRLANTSNSSSAANTLKPAKIYVVLLIKSVGLICIPTPTTATTTQMLLLRLRRRQRGGGGAGGGGAGGGVGVGTGVGGGGVGGCPSETCDFSAPATCKGLRLGGNVTQAALFCKLRGTEMA